MIAHNTIPRLTVVFLFLKRLKNEWDNSNKAFQSLYGGDFENFAGYRSLENTNEKKNRRFN